MKYCELSDILKPATAVEGTDKPAAMGEDPSESFKEQMAGPAAIAPSVPTPPAKPALAKAPASTSQFDFFDTNATADVTPNALLQLPKSAPGFSTARTRPSAPPLVSTNAVTAGPEVTILIDDKTGGEPRRIVIPQASKWMLEMLTGEPSEAEPAVTSTLRPIQAIHVKQR